MITKLEYYNIYTATALQTVFPYTFPILAAADIKVYDDGLVMLLGVDYTITGAGSENGGNVTFVTGRTAGHTIYFHRNTPRTQATDLVAGAKFYEADIEAMADKLTMILQEFPGLTIPLSPAGYFLRTKANGSGIEAVTAITTGVVMPFDTGIGPPGSGTWALGFIRFNSAPALGGNVGWVCTATGSPGVWAEFGFVSANPV